MKVDGMRAGGLLVFMVLLAGSALGAPAPWSPPRTPDGVPDLQGVWTNASITTLTRNSSSRPLVVGDDEAAGILKAQLQYREKANAPTSSTAPAPPVAGDPGGYNAFWVDPGSALGRVKGEWRTSWIVDPPSGQLPFSEQGRVLVAKAKVFAAAADAPAQPESLQPWDRCLIGSRGSGGPGMLNNIYNNSYQFVQTRDAIAIEVEMIHEVRIIPLFADKRAGEAAHRPAAITPWLGDSVGWWDKDTLVVETTQVNPEQGRAGPLYLSASARVTERFTRVGPAEILYEFLVEDPTYYSQPWRAEMTFKPQNGRLFEYACHEGNYAMLDILRGARLAEKSKLGAAPATSAEIKSAK